MKPSIVIDCIALAEKGYNILASARLSVLSRLNHLDRFDSSEVRALTDNQVHYFTDFRQCQRSDVLFPLGHLRHIIALTNITVIIMLLL